MFEQSPITVNILATPVSSASTLFGLFDVLGSVGSAWENYVTGKPVDPQFNVRIVAATKEPFLCDGNILVVPHCSFDEVEDVGIVIVGGLVIPNTQPPKFIGQRELDWLLSHKNRGAIIAGTCTGALMLAESGLLNGWEATSHWAYRDLIQAYYPDVRWCLQHQLCISGHGNQFVTSGGATSWQALALHLVTRFCGVERATQTAKSWLIPIQEEMQAPFAVMTKGIRHDDGIVNKSQEWIAEHYANSNPVTVMAERSGLSASTFSRRFKRATGYHPMDYVHTLRIEEAKEMLEMSGNAIEQIGREVGYEDPASFRRIFKRKVSLTPSIYRKKFGRVEV